MTIRHSHERAAATATVIVLVAVADLACSFMPESQRNAFVTRFLESVRDDTGYYRQYLHERDLPHAEAARPILARGFKIKGWSGPFGPDECYIETPDGSTIVLYVIQRHRSVKEVVMNVHLATRHRR